MGINTETLQMLDKAIFIRPGQQVYMYKRS